MSFKGQSQYTTNGLLLQFVCKHKPGAPSGDNTNEWVAGCHAWLTFSAMLPTKLAMSGLSDLVTPLGYSPNLKVQFWKSLPSNVRKESKQASICLMNIWHHYRLAIFPPPIHKTISTWLQHHRTFFYIKPSICIIQREGGDNLYWFECPFNERNFKHYKKVWFLRVQWQDSILLSCEEYWVN
jgi:hypothetical protein